MIGAAVLPLAAFAAAPAAEFIAPKVDPASVKIMANYAACAVDRDPAKAETIVASDYRSPAYQRAIRDFAQAERGCVPRGGKLRFQGLVFAGDMAESLLRRRAVGAEALEKAAVAAESDARTLGSAACVVQKRPGDTAAVFETPHASKPEGQALARLAETLATCTPQGATLLTNAVGLRAMLAVAAFRLAMNIPAPAPVGN